MSDQSEFFGPPIFSYTRRQAIEDGVLVQLSGPGYEGDQWIPDMCKEAGFKFPIAMTVEAFTSYVSPLEDSGMELVQCQDIQGRLWDVLHMLRVAARNAEGDTILFQLYVVPNVPKGSSTLPKKAKKVTLKCVCGPDDDASPCLTIMLPTED